AAEEAARLAAEEAARLAAEEAERLVIEEAARLAAEQLAEKQAKKLAELVAREAARVAEIARLAVLEEIRTNPLAASRAPKPEIMAYVDFPEIAFNPIKPVVNPLTVYKLANIAHNLPAIDGLTRLHLEKLAGGNSVIKGLKIWKAEQKTLKRQLQLNNYKSFWFTNNQLDLDKANEVIATIQNAEAFAFVPSRYKLDELQQLIYLATANIKPAWRAIPGTKQQLAIMRKDEELNNFALNQAKLELALTHASMAYSRHASAGQVIPSAIDRNNDVKPVATSAISILTSIKTLKQPGELQAWLEAQHPQGKQFKALLAEFKRQSAADESKISNIRVPAGELLKLGNQSNRVVKLAQRLEQLGFYDSSLHNGYPREYNKIIVASVRAFQTEEGLQADGITGDQTVNALNFEQPDRLRTLLVNLERQRWTPHKMGQKHVVVNQPEFRLRIFEDEQITFSTRVVVGRKKFQTPIFNNKIATVVVNPYWNIPNSIIYNEMRSQINNDPGYLARNNYQVLGDLNWDKATPRYVPFRIRQKPGNSNALGRVKFLFPNRHSIYLHDTPSKSLFSKSSRAYSHGCIRVQNPNLLALNLMGWTQKKFDSLVAAGTNRHFALKNKVPVYLTYLTAYADDDDNIRYFSDMYDRDGKVARALGVDQIILDIAAKKKQQTNMVVSAN
ncbi:MAG: L,D-transpeptidase family protein, partial [Rhizobiales bacterium]|nr:L,D-transpeptidase family protein [Hyphomicrobiales bacterium]